MEIEDYEYFKNIIFFFWVYQKWSFEYGRRMRWKDRRNDKNPHAKDKYISYFYKESQILRSFGPIFLRWKSWKCGAYLE